MQQNRIFDKFTSAVTADSSMDILLQIEKLAQLHKACALSGAELQTNKELMLVFNFPFFK